MHKTYVLWMLAAACCSPATASALDEAAATRAISDAFAAANAEGTMIVRWVDTGRQVAWRPQRAETRLSPASTFKIPNTLIALEFGVVQSEESRFEWDGTVRDVAAWNANQTLASAFRASCVWCYQKIARSVGKARYRLQLAALDYGNRTVGNAVDRFWLNGALRISATEQIEFLEKLVSGSLPFSNRHQQVLKSIMRVEETERYSLYAKTGWTGPELHVGWYVGYLERDGETVLFAMNMDLYKAKRATLRAEIVRNALRGLNLIT